MVFATAINGGLMFVMAITLCYVIGDLTEVLATPTGYPFIQIFYNSTRSVAATNAMTSIVIILSAFSCVTVMAGSSRQLFAFARDGAIPFSRWVSYVRPGFDVPVNAVLVIFVIASCIALVNIGSTVAFNIITSLGTGTLTTSYIVCISILIWRKVTNQPMLPSRFNMGKTLGLVVNIVSLLWLCLVLIIAFCKFRTSILREERCTDLASSPGCASVIVRGSRQHELGHRRVLRRHHFQLGLLRGVWKQVVRWPGRVRSEARLECRRGAALVLCTSRLSS